MSRTAGALPLPGMVDEGCPMLVLGMETATSVCGVALVAEGKLCGEARIVGPNLHNERLHGMLRSLFVQCAVRPYDLHGIAVSIGPGSFTGLRIGLAAAKGLALVTETKVVGISTLQALARQATEAAEVICAIIPAKAKLFYLGQFRQEDGALELQGSVEVVAAEALPELVPAGAVVAGPGCWHLDPAILRAVRQRATVDLSLRSFPSAASVAVLGYQRLVAGACDDVVSLEPQYVQEFVAATPKRIIDLQS
ncbi:MAG: tRNA (adenosine(37)-N6)-threonylcarbamoyltransferase complex dimerization subunit type 1 TsaB [bacterium]|jgi:tRNA threonylcarbamoyladenosine biosynthesis protein TsaB|nr:tRNA (adenosine(37)-N6)-threonylcarbamoyltransferase complex dimerization subunit type 1 TsaB [candidate division KSB1 bacterium]MDH7559065.1 tRNA (adenosine(37)-N6)-threonylcarbamoyltransferase complex dimerization subunit type 1 TsaB [bacterium]